MTLVLFRRRALGEQSGAEQKVGARVRKSRQKEAAGAADAGLMQIEWSKGEVLRWAGVGTEEEEGCSEARSLSEKSRLQRSSWGQTKQLQALQLIRAT